MNFPNETEREAIDTAFGYVPEPEPLENMLAVVGRIVAAREAQAAAKALRDAERVVRDVRHSGDPGPVIDELTGEGGWALGMNRAASIVRLQAEIRRAG